MRGIRVSEYGGVDVLKLISGIQVPKPNQKQILVNVKAAGVNPVDTYIRSGNYANKPKLPFTPGKDGAGLVTEIGEDVSKVKVGDRVWFTGSLSGSCAEYCVCSEENVALLPLSHDFISGAMIGGPYLTAYRAIFQKGKAKSGEKVLIHGATGGVGTAAVQICLFHGINVVATAGSEDGEKMLMKMGVTKIYNHKEDGYEEKILKNEGPVDMILEMLANVNLVRDCSMIAPNGRIVVIGSRGSIDFNPRLLMQTEGTIIGCKLGKSTSEERAEQITFIEEALTKDWLKPMLWKTYELENAKDAHRDIIENTGTTGQIVLKVEI